MWESLYLQQTLLFFCIVEVTCTSSHTREKSCWNNLLSLSLPHLSVSHLWIQPSYYVITSNIDNSAFFVLVPTIWFFFFQVKFYSSTYFFVPTPSIRCINLCLHSQTCLITRISPRPALRLVDITVSCSTYVPLW